MKQILIRTDRCLGCKSCENACKVAHSAQGNLFGAVLGGERLTSRVKVETNRERTLNLPVQCRQCQQPRCVSGCMTGAMYVNEEGLVLNREEKCVGCWMCVMVCPYGVIAQDHHKAVKCDQCLSLGHEPACVQACPTHAIKFAPIADFDKQIRQQFLSRFEKGEEV
ncbi:MAG TPA: 4Fe-4S dicluster domain-containing protein [Bacillota bacterium]|nr:4Fe-4S dicluster domain-containing protein [Bacillota bacterium]